MRTVSMVMDWKHDEWYRRMTPDVSPPSQPIPAIKLPTPEEIDEFRRLLERAREYDRKMGQPDCELEEKRQKVRDLAKQLGVSVEFV